MGPSHVSRLGCVGSKPGRSEDCEYEALSQNDNNQSENTFADGRCTSGELRCRRRRSAGSLSPEVIGMFPQNAGEVAFADLRQARSLAWYPRLREQMLPERFRQFEKLLASAGMDPNSQVEELAWALVPGDSPVSSSKNIAVPAGDEVVGVALGPFSPENVETYFKTRKLTVMKVRDYSIYAFDGDLFFCFIDSNTVAFGHREGLEKLIAVRVGEEQSLLSNTELAPLISQANGGTVVWSVLSAPYARVAMKQLVPQTAEFPQAQQLFSKLGALTLEISVANGGIKAHFEAMCASVQKTPIPSPSCCKPACSTRATQAASSNPDLAAMLLQAEALRPSADRLEVILLLTEDQVVALIQRNTFAIHL